MKKENTRQSKRSASWLKLMLLTALIGGLGLMSTACGKKNDSAPAVAAPPPVIAYPTGPNIMCHSCPGNMMFLVSALAQWFELQGPGSPIEIGLDFFGDGAALGRLQGFQPGMYLPLQTGPYFGPVAASGFLNINTPQGLPECGLPPGRYALQTLRPGVFGADSAGRSAENIVLTMAGGPVPLEIYVSGFTMPAAPPAQGSDGKTYPYRFTATTFQMKRADSPMLCQRLDLQLQ